jgi:chromosome segregation ATPase
MQKLRGEVSRLEGEIQAREQVMSRLEPELRRLSGLTEGLKEERDEARKLLSLQSVHVPDQQDHDDATGRGADLDGAGAVGLGTRQREESVRRDAELERFKEDAVRRDAELERFKEDAVRRVAELQKFKEDAVGRDAELERFKEDAVRRDAELQKFKEDAVKREAELERVQEEAKQARSDSSRLITSITDGSRRDHHGDGAESSLVRGLREELAGLRGVMATKDREFEDLKSRDVAAVGRERGRVEEMRVECERFRAELGVISRENAVLRAEVAR